MSVRTKMYVVLLICCLMLLVSIGIAFFLVRGGEPSAPGAGGEETLITESGYNKNAYTIDAAAYDSVVLGESADAGQGYVNETLFLGDSNTARMYRLYDYCTYANAIGSVGMAARSLESYACVRFSGSSGYVTMPQAVSMMQPRRVILTFGTNDLDPNLSAAKFIENYQAGIQAVVSAYPSVDIIVNSIPPLGQQHTNQLLTQGQVDEFNKALVDMCQAQGWKFLNSAEVLKDEATGFAKAGYVESSDGIHLTRSAMDALFTYLRTHSYVTEDDRPFVTKVPEHVEDLDVVSTGTVVASAAPTAEPTEEPEDEPEPTAPPKPTATLAPVTTTAPTATPTATPSPTPTVEPTAEPTATPTPAPTAAPTPEPTAPPTPTPTAEPTQEPTAAPTESPTSEQSDTPAQTGTE